MNKKSLNEVYKQTTFRNVKRVNSCRENTAKDNAWSPVYLFVFFFQAGICSSVNMETLVRTSRIFNLKTVSVFQG